MYLMRPGLSQQPWVLGGTVGGVYIPVPPGSHVPQPVPTPASVPNSIPNKLNSHCTILVILAAVNAIVRVLNDSNMSQPGAPLQLVYHCSLGPHHS